MERRGSNGVITKTNAGAAPPLTRRLMIAFALGSLAESAVLATLADFLLVFYNQVRGLPAHLIGMAAAASLVLNAFADPMIGSWSDRTRSRWGRRHPFMAASILPLVISFFAIFNPPNGLGQTGELTWLTIWNVVLLQSVSFFHTPHLALGGELTSHYTGRSRVMSYNTFFLWIGGSARWCLAFGYFFRATPGFPNGLLNPAAWPPFIVVMTSLAFASLVASTWFTRSRIPFLPQPNPDGSRFGLRDLISDIGCALRNRSYVGLLVGYLSLSLMQGLRAGLWLYIATFFFRLTSAQLFWFVVGSLAGYALGSAVVTPLHRRFDKRATLVGAVLVYSIGPALPMALGLAGILTPQTPGLLVILIALITLEHAPFSVMTTTVNSALADIADENDLRYGVRQEGMLYSTRAFFQKVDQALGGVLAGLALTLIAFPAKAQPGHVPAPVLANLLWAFVLSTLPGLVAMVFYGGLKITRESHARVRVALDTREGTPPQPTAAPDAPMIAAPTPRPSPL